MNKSEKLTDEDLKQMVFRKNNTVNFEVKDSIVTIIRPQDHPIQNFFRKLHFKIPENSYLDLDEYGSFVFQMIDGKQNVYEIGQALGEKYDEANEYLYSRLLLYLEHIETNEKLIERVI